MFKQPIDTNFKKCNWYYDTEPDRTNWHGFDTFCFSVNKPVYLCGIGIYGRTPSSSLEIRKPEAFDLSVRNQDYCLIAENDVEVRHDGSPRTHELLLKNYVLLDERRVYHLRIAQKIKNEFENFIGVGIKTECNINGVVFKNENYFRQSCVISTIIYKEV